MKNKRFEFDDRRQNNVMPNVPFKDSNGLTIKECRRKIPDRRTGIYVKWVRGFMID